MFIYLVAQLFVRLVIELIRGSILDTCSNTQNLTDQESFEIIELKLNSKELGPEKILDQ